MHGQLKNNPNPHFGWVVYIKPRSYSSIQTDSLLYKHLQPSVALCRCVLSIYNYPRLGTS